VSGSGVRCDNCGPVWRERQTFESLYDTGAGWHDEKDGESDKREIRILGGGRGR